MTVYLKTMALLVSLSSDGKHSNSMQRQVLYCQCENCAPTHTHTQKKKGELFSNWSTLKSISVHRKGCCCCCCCCRFKSNCPLVTPGFTRGMSSGSVFLRDPNPYLHEFRRKPRKTPNGQVDKRDWELNSVPPVYQLRAQNHSATGGGEYKKEMIL